MMGETAMTFKGEFVGLGSIRMDEYAYIPF